MNQPATTRRGDLCARCRARGILLRPCKWVRRGGRWLARVLCRSDLPCDGCHAKVQLRKLKDLADRLQSHDAAQLPVHREALRGWTARNGFARLDEDSLPEFVKLREEVEQMCELPGRNASSLTQTASLTSRKIETLLNCRCWTCSCAPSSEKVDFRDIEMLPPLAECTWKSWYGDLARQVEREDGLVNYRTTWMMAFQAGPAAIASVLAVPLLDGTVEHPWVVGFSCLSIAGAGIYSAWRALGGVRAAQAALLDLKRAYEASPTVFQKAYVRPYGAKRMHDAGGKAGRAIPKTTIALWLGFGLLVSWEMLRPRGASHSESCPYGRDTSRSCWLTSSAPNARSQSPQTGGRPQSGP
jgi:hypothetical protein